MKPCLALVADLLFVTASFAAGDLRTLILQDDFERSASQETTDEPSNGWGTNRQNRATELGVAGSVKRQGTHA